MLRRAGRPVHGWYFWFLGSMINLKQKGRLWVGNLLNAKHEGLSAWFYLTKTVDLFRTRAPGFRLLTCFLMSLPAGRKATIPTTTEAQFNFAGVPV